MSAGLADMAKEESTVQEIGDYLVFPLTLPSLPSYPVTATHYLYVSRHRPIEPDTTTPRSLFLVNIPFDSTTAHLKHLFSLQLGLPAGRIEQVRFAGEHDGAAEKQSENPLGVRAGKKGKKRKRMDENINLGHVPGAELPSTWDRKLQMDGLTATLTFVDRASLESTLKAVRTMIKAEKRPVWGEGIEDKVPQLGSSRYSTHRQLSYPDKSSLLRSIDTYMTAFAANEAAQAQVQAKRRQEPDEDGFVTVTKGGRNHPAQQQSAQNSADKQKEKRKGLADFYRFQSREKRKEKAQELVRKFQEDQEKVRGMKERRQKFLPG